MINGKSRRLPQALGQALLLGNQQIFQTFKIARDSLRRMRLT